MVQEEDRSGPEHHVPPNCFTSSRGEKPKRAPRRKDTDLLHHENISARQATAHAVGENLKNKRFLKKQLGVGGGGCLTWFKQRRYPAQLAHSRRTKCSRAKPLKALNRERPLSSRRWGSTRKQDAHPHNKYSDFT